LALNKNNKSNNRCCCH